MDLKKLFSQNNRTGTPENKPEERQITRINALEVQVKHLLQFEKQARPILLKLGRREGERPDASDMMVPNKEYEQLLQKVNGLERKVRQKNTSTGSTQTSQSNQKGEAGLSSIQAKITALEANFLLLNEVQAVIMRQIADLSEKLADRSKSTSESEDLESKQEPLFKTLYVDKLFLDKYEQNNNFAQLGIKELNGALNIGATYGKDVVPKAVTDQIQEDIAQMKAMKQQKHQKESSGDEMDKQESYNEEIDLEYTNIQIKDDPFQGEG
ncbi:hypothetical protein [Neobacillus muris]|uniref:hypothetical protein n=1 Tax=Neobacillus muris TaxID=2941334 RepID=UPI00203D2D88|nr:hypothetical protein [Neobacillus muris]